MLADFHFIRPLWLLLLPLIPLLLVGLWQYRSSGASWQTLIAPGLRNYLIDGQSGRLSKWLFVMLGFGWLLGVLALAGPAWQRLPQPVYQTGDAMVIVADLSPSMLARDVAPSRLERMRYKLTDLIKAREEGMTALVVYAGDSHVLAPLSDDRQTLLALLPGLSPQIMPIPGSHTEEAVALALDLFKQDNRRQGSVVLLTDGVTAQAARGVNELFAGLPAGTDFSLSVMGIGTAEGAPIPLTEGFAKDAAGKIVVARLDAQRLSQLAAVNDGIYTAMQLDNSDTDALLNAAAGLLPVNGSDREGENQQAAEQTFDRWQEAGSWLLLLLLPIAALAFRRGWLLAVCFAFIVPAVHSPQVTAAEAGNSLWENLWQTPDQQGAKALTAGDAATAAELFQRPDWQAAARYRNGDYTAAAEQFAAQGDTEGLYNSGNALAKAGKLKEALAAYEQVLDEQPDHEDAQANKALIEKLMQQQQNQNQQGEGQDQQDQNQQSQQDQNQQGQQDQNQQGESQQSQNQQSEGEQGQQDQNQQGDSQQAQSQQQSDSQDQAEQLSQQVDQQQQEALDKQQAEKAADEFQAEQQDGAQAQVQAEQQSSPEDEALQKWLGQLPEDPAGLLRNKFNYEYQKKRQAYESGDWKPAQEQRW
ncbi:vWA domain-containing protein [Aliamphritea spongicola]|uniref:vWA domain-containing protein n=1 Tax=Aliamphritea spongicola TaxID=707589 RepID=UPI00196A3218|nr:VWA domain-containing protein [Aliamphritea spongicola]MBN3563299.1 VWA domain-containing protein [Aliamphritea spongicola]